MATENWSPKKGEKIRASMKPLRNGNKGVIVEFCYHTLHGTVVDTDDEEWEYYDRYEEPAAQTWKDVVASEKYDGVKSKPIIDDEAPYNIPANSIKSVVNGEESWVTLPGYIPEKEQQQIKEKLMPELEKEIIKDKYELSAAIRERDELMTCAWIPGSLNAKRINDLDFAIAAYKHKQNSLPVVGKMYEFWNGSEEPVFEGVFIAKCNGIYLATLRKFYSYLHEGKALTIVPYKNFRKKKEPIKITIDQVLEKFNISKDDKVVLEGNNSNVSVNLTPHFDNGISPTVLGYLSGMNPGATRPHNFSLGDDGFTDKTDIFDNKGMD